MRDREPLGLYKEKGEWTNSVKIFFDFTSKYILIFSSALVTIKSNWRPEENVSISIHLTCLQQLENQIKTNSSPIPILRYERNVSIKKCWN